jgi:hypothetical protein
LATSSATLALGKVLTAIDAQLDRLNASPGRIAASRAVILNRLRDALGGGFLPREAYEPLSLVPFIFQEANYDGIDWVQPGADLAQLTPLFEIDARIWSGGRSLSEFSEPEHADYVARALRAIQARPLIRRDMWIASRVNGIRGWEASRRWLFRASKLISPCHFTSCDLNHANTYAALSMSRLGRAEMSCEAFGTRTSAVSILRSFSAW